VTAPSRHPLSRHPLLPHREVDPSQSLPGLELEVLERWRERDVFAESLRRREGAPQWVFYEGPPTANGPPGSHHVLSRVFKDVYPRFQTMRGYRVERKGGWDCHGLPVEIAVEQELGDRGVRDRGVQREVPRVGVHVPGGVEPADGADRLLDRSRARVPHAG
jgi:isoleucyl-tRNA synthetase